MKAKNILKGMWAHNMMRHRQHRRFISNLRTQIHQFGPGRGLLFLGAIGLAGRFLQKRRTPETAELPEVTGGS